MTEELSENKLATTGSENGSSGVGHSKMQTSKGGASAPSNEATLEALNATIASLSAKIETLEKEKSDANTSANTIAAAIAAAMQQVAAKTSPVQPVPAENINTSKDYSARNLVDGRSLMEAQETLMLYKHEAKLPISIPKSFANYIGPALPVSVNGVRVSIPCDGKTHYINETHVEAARERLAKLDRLIEDDRPTIIETNA